MLNVENNIKRLPEGWKYVHLKEVCEQILGGGTPSTKIQEYWEGDIPWISSADIEGLREINPRKKVSEKAIKNSAANVLPKGGIIVVTRVGLGKIAIAPYEICFSQDSQGLILKEDLITQSYALVCLSRAVQKFKQESRGTTISGVTKKQLTELIIPLPPKPIQEEIVCKIEELFSEIDKGTEQLKTAQQQLKIYRQAVLNKLVSEKNLRTIESVITKLDQGWSPKCENEASTSVEEWAVIKTSAVQHGNFVDCENKRLPKELKAREQHELIEGDILITRAGPKVRVGVCCLVKHVRPKLLNCDKVYRIKVNKSLIAAEYLVSILNTPKYLREIERMKTGINDSGVNLTQKGFLNIQIPVPSIEEQLNIVQEIESRLSVADKMEESIGQSLQQAEVLRQSILKKAFEGTLI